MTDIPSITTFLRINGKSEQSSDEEVTAALQQAHYSGEEIQAYLASRRQPATSAGPISNNESIALKAIPPTSQKMQSKPASTVSKGGITILVVLGGLGLVAGVIVFGFAAYFIFTSSYSVHFPSTEFSASCAGGGKLLVTMDHGDNTLENYTTNYYLNYKEGSSNRVITPLRVEEYNYLDKDHLPNPLPLHTNVTVHEFDQLTINSTPEDSEAGGSPRPITLFFDPATYSREEFETISSCLQQSHSAIEDYFAGHPEGAAHVPHFIGTGYITAGAITGKIHEINHGGHFTLNNEALLYQPTISGDFIEVLDSGAVVFDTKRDAYSKQDYRRTYIASIFDLSEPNAFPWFDGTATTTIRNTNGPGYENLSKAELDRMIQSDNQIGLAKNEQGMTLREYLRTVTNQAKTF